VVLYRRNPLPGGTFFFTVALRDRRATTLVDYVGLLRAAFASEKARNPFEIDAIVILPDHLHTIWTLPLGDGDFSGRWRSIKSDFVRRLARADTALTGNRKGEALVWQRRFWEHTVRDDADFAAHCHYIHYNPVKHGLVNRPSDWRYSSIHRFVECGLYPADWAVAPDSVDEGFGEPG
jgi:putative transposase